MNDNENIICQNVWHGARVVFTGNCRALNVYVKKEERLKISDLIIHLKEKNIRVVINEKTSRK